MFSKFNYYTFTLKRNLIFEERVELLVNETKKVPIGTIVIENQSFGKYTGTLFVRIGKH